MNFTFPAIVLGFFLSVAAHFVLSPAFSWPYRPERRVSRGQTRASPTPL